MYKPDGSRSRGPRDFANRQEAGVGIPNADTPTEAEAAPRTDLDETRHDAAANNLTNGAESDDRIIPLSIRVFGPIYQEVFGLPRHPRIPGIGPVDQVERVFRRNVPSRIDEHGFEFDDALAFDRKMLSSEIAVIPVVATCSNHLLERLRVIDRDRHDARGGNRRRKGFAFHGNDLGAAFQNVEDLGEEATAFAECLNPLIVPVAFATECQLQFVCLSNIEHKLRVHGFIFL